MASIGNDAGGRRRILFFDPNGVRRTLRLGKTSKRQAESVKTHIENLVSGLITRTAPPQETSRWLAGLDDALRDRLAAVGLTERRDRQALGAYVAAYILERTDAAPNTVAKWRTVEKLLNQFFGADTPLADISADDAERWRRSFVGKPTRRREGTTKENSIRKHVAVAKVFFNAAVRKKLIAASPFDGQSSSTLANDSRLYFVSAEESARVLDACPNAEWRLIFALARWGGLRVPSELTGLQWADVNWEGSRMAVRSPKTHRHPDGGLRFVPLFPELRTHLEAAFEAAPDGAVYVVPRAHSGAVNLRKYLMAIIAKAGLTPWPKLFQNLRATRETELVESFPIHVVCRWLGNTPKVAAKHYLQTTDKHFADAVGVAQNPAQQAHARGCNAMNGTEAPTVK